MDPELEVVKEEARRLHSRAAHWRVVIPEEWYVNDPEDSESFIGGLYHDRVRAMIWNKTWNVTTVSVGIAIAIIAAVLA